MQASSNATAGRGPKEAATTTNPHRSRASFRCPAPGTHRGGIGGAYSNPVRKRGLSSSVTAFFTDPSPRTGTPAFTARRFALGRVAAVGLKFIHHSRDDGLAVNGVVSGSTVIEPARATHFSAGASANPRCGLSARSAITVNTPATTAEIAKPAR